ncbi:hypothetical protein EK21DRAFT_97018 [Setomelanomma holmii]|uniref:Uncharacterized protein n=1 Tax=Setomelanomma holmii TaxID=210430 RepID=A0A9P4LU20_9PLEO|nr:hypothetical protein EK21DRAFT_97018 [Setomelanomma holmii]
MAVANGNGQLARRTAIKSYEAPKLSIVEMWSLLLSQLKATTATVKSRYDERARIEKEISARTDEWCIDIFMEQYTRLEHLTSELEMQLAITQNLGQSQKQAVSPLASFALTPWQMEERYRALIQLQSCLGSFFERASPAYDQSKTVWWFDPSYHQSEGLNYDRYGAPDVRESEARLLNALALGNENIPTKLLLTSSGVAAFTVLNQFLLSQVLHAGDTIVIAPYLYFECFDHLRRISHVRVINSDTFDAEDIIATAEKNNAKAIYLDPMANTLGLDTTDIRRFAHPKVLYYESAHKYIQMGMDVVMLGLLVYPEEFHETMGLIRQVTGTTLYTRQANVLPPIDYNIHQSRMYWLTTNAEKLYHLLDKQASTIAKFNFPTHWRKMGWSSGGNVVTIRLFGDDQINKRPSLDAFTSLVLRTAEEEGVGMTKGGGLGFSVTRIWPSTPFIRNEDPYMRISVGVDPDEVEPVARSIIKGLERHYRASKPGLPQWKLRENGLHKTNGLLEAYR